MRKILATTAGAIMKRHGQPLAQATASGRVADLAAEGLIYAQGSTVEEIGRAHV